MKYYNTPTAAPTIDVETFKPRGKCVSKTERAALAAAGMKYCPACQTAKPREEFGPNRSKSDGLRSRCKPCDREAHREAARRWRVANPEANREANREAARRWYWGDPEHARKVKREAPSRKRRNATIYRAKVVLEKAVEHFHDRPGWLSRIAHAIDADPQALQLQYVSETLDGLTAAYVYGEV